MKDLCYTILEKQGILYYIIFKRFILIMMIVDG